jgi:hypothetical protein
MQALIKANFWLLFFSLLLGSGSGLIVIDNLGQMSQSLGYEETHIFVSMISIWNCSGPSTSEGPQKCDLTMFLEYNT